MTTAKLRIDPPGGTAVLAGRPVARIGFGAMQLPGPGVWGPPRDRETALAVLRRAVELGVNHIDTAAFYFSATRSANELINTALAPYPDELVIVTKDGEVESESLLRELAPTSVPLVMSTEAWTSYEVPVSPYFVYIDAESGEIRGEGAASTWPHVQRLLEDAIADLALTPRTGKTGSGNLGRGRLTDSHPDRIREIDAILAAAGITPDHPSLWPEGRPPPPDRSPAD